MDTLVGADTDHFNAVVRRPGMDLGHRMRDYKAGATPSAPAPVQQTTGVLIVGSGVAALSCAWALRRSGFDDFRLLEGPAPLGNAAGAVHRFGAYPQGAHYLPPPSRSCQHVREILHDQGILLEGIDADEPLYDERAVVHAPMERVLQAGRWHAGILPPLEEGSDAQKQWHLVQERFKAFKDSRTPDGNETFALPLGRRLAQPGGLEPSDRLLDAISFRHWLSQAGVNNRSLSWYFDYCCRDEFGADAAQVSAWAGIHYFCARKGRARHAEPGAVLTWPQGLSRLAQGLLSRLQDQQRLMGIAVFAGQDPVSGDHLVDVLSPSGQTNRIRARRLVVATPLAVARRLVPHAFADLAGETGPVSSPWMVSNLFLSRFPAELPGDPLAWDNVVEGSPGLGYIVATHQHIRVARPETTIFTAYRAMGGPDNGMQRRFLATASAHELLDLARVDLDQAYGPHWQRHCTGAEITVHGHGMPTPVPGFLTESLAQRARDMTRQGSRLLFAHGDLSGYSVFEEASYWGTRAAALLT